MKICIVSDQHISANPRVWKEATTLSDSGYKVVVVTQASLVKKLEDDRRLIEKFNNKFDYKIAVNVIDQVGNSSKALSLKIRRKLALIFKRMFKIDSKYLLSYDPDSLYKAAKKENADFYIAHVEAGLYVGKKLIGDGKRVAFDIEDWYSRDYLVPTRPVSLLANLERYALTNGYYVSCPSYSMAKELAQAYNSKTPDIIYNSFPDEEIIDVPVTGGNEIKVIWFSQTIGRGRGLESFFSAITEPKYPIRVTLLGKCSEEYKSVLHKLTESVKNIQLEFMSPVSHVELTSLLKKFDIGLALEYNISDSRRTTITNKILQYLQAGLKVFATGTEGQKEVGAYFPNAVSLVSLEDKSDWNEKLNMLIETDIDKEQLETEYNKTFAWDLQKSKLLSLIASNIQ